MSKVAKEAHCSAGRVLLSDQRYNGLSLSIKEKNSRVFMQHSETAQQNTDDIMTLKMLYQYFIQQQWL